MTDTRKKGGLLILFEPILWTPSINGTMCRLRILYKCLGRVVRKKLFYNLTQMLEPAPRNITIKRTTGGGSGSTRTVGQRAPYQDLGRVLHEPDAGTRVREAVEVLGLAVQPVADDVAADDLVLHHVRRALHRRFRFGLQHGRRAVVRRRPFERRRSCQKRTDNRTGIHVLKNGRRRSNRSAPGYSGEYRFDAFTAGLTYENGAKTESKGRLRRRRKRKGKTRLTGPRVVENEKTYAV